VTDKSDKSKSKVRLGRPPRGGQSIDDIRDLKPTDRHGIDRYLDDEEYEQSRRSILHPHPDDFHVALSDSDGNFRKIAGLRVHPTLENEVMMLFNRRTFPWSTPHDILRCALIDYLRKCWEVEKRHGGVPNYIARLDAINRTSLKYEEMLRFDGERKRIHEVADSLVNAGKRAAAAEFISVQLADIKDIPQKSWRDDLLQDIERAYGWLMKSEGKRVRMKRGRK